jgi:hypothetical protein
MALLLVSGQAVAQEPIREKTESVPEQKASSPTSSDATVQAAATGPTTSGMILVSKRPVELLASPSSSASGIYGFPAGRRFRVIGQEAGFAHLQDVKSGATGWIDETALWQSPSVPTVSVEPKPKATPRGSQCRLSRSRPHALKRAQRPRPNGSPKRPRAPKRRPFKTPSDMASSVCGAIVPREFYSDPGVRAR